MEKMMLEKLTEVSKILMLAQEKVDHLRKILMLILKKNGKLPGLEDKGGLENIGTFGGEIK